jgi:multisubunit Na+/H+ antiporter MnhB subunit
MARLRTATDDHFDPGHALIALVIFGVSLIAYMQLVNKPKR